MDRRASKTISTLGILCDISILEMVTQCKLDLPRRGAADCRGESIRAIVNVAVGHTEVRVVEKVKELSAKVQVLTFSDVEGFSERKIKIAKSRAP